MEVAEAQRKGESNRGNHRRRFGSKSRLAKHDDAHMRATSQHKSLHVKIGYLLLVIITVHLTVTAMTVHNAMVCKVTT